MAAAAPMAPPDNAQHSGDQTGRRRGVQPLRAGQGHSFLWHKLHSLSGIVPIGAFLVEHIISNFETWNGPLAYAQQVKFLNALPLVRILEWGLIFLPLAFHALYGVFITVRGRASVNVYPWAGNWAYLTQRITGIIALAYIVYHVWRQRFSGVNLPEHPGAAFHKVQVELSHPWVVAVYVIAMVATCWHFAYGVWLFAAKWGITPGNRARKRFGWACAAGGSALCLLGLMSIYAVRFKPEYQNAPADVMPAQPAGVVLPAPQTAAPGTTNPSQPGEVQPEGNAGTAPHASLNSADSAAGSPKKSIDLSAGLVPSNVPMFDPEGVVRLVPYNEVGRALQSGGARAIRVEDASGVLRWIHEDQISKALGDGAHVLSDSPPVSR